MWGIDFDLEMNLHVIKRQECFWVLMGGDSMDCFVQFQF